MSNRVPHSPHFPAIAATSLLLFSACGAAPPHGEPLAVVEAWSRASGEGTNSAAYISLVNTDTLPARIVSATTRLARNTEFHETTLADGVANMIAADSLIIGPQSPLVMEPGGLHLMLMELIAPVSAGDTIPVALRLASGRTLNVKVVVRPR